MKMRLPNFLIIGAHKAGTTSLYYYLKSHPEIFMPSLKEARFFAYNPDRAVHRSKAGKAFPITTLKEYSALFDGVKNEKVYGEASPNYLGSGYAANKIYQHIPEAKLIASLRNPVDRAYSQFLMAHRAGVITNTKINEFKCTRSDAEKGFYYTKVKRYIELFGNDQIKVILFEDLTNNTSEVVKELFKFLNVSEEYSPDVDKVHNKGGIPKSMFVHRLTKSKDMKRLANTYLPNSLIQVLRKIKSNNMNKALKLTDLQRKDAIKYFKEDLMKLESLIKRDLSAWYDI